MNDTIHGNPDALVAYLYDECDPAERDAVAAHVAHCAACADDIEGLRTTRRVLAGWAPPDAALGFQIARPQDALPAAVLPFGAGPARHATSWWRQPLPAWAQAAAAVLVFAAGLGIGSGTIREATSVAVAPDAVAPPAADPAPVPLRTPAAVTRDDLARLEQRLLAIERGQVRQASAPPAAALTEEALLSRVQAIVEASEERQRRENVTMQTNIATLADYVRGFDAQRRADLRLVEDRLGRIQGATGVELQQQRDALNYFVRTSLTGSAGR